MINPDISLKKKNMFRSCVWLQILLQVIVPFLSILPHGAIAHSSSTIGTTQSPFTVDRELGLIATNATMLPYTNTMSSLASALASSDADDISGSARSEATSYASSSGQQWLSQFGTARVQLNVDDNGNWDDSAIDFLAPLYDNKKSMLFTQLGLRAPDGRITGNMGMGVRTFYQKNWMFGGNVFFDDDFTGKNRRVGFGAEAWTDYLKLAANTYVGTTEWHSSRDFDDYNEKPADGFDVRAEGYLPVYPQLGAKLMYEQYYGNDVALFDKEHLQNNPSAVTVGLNYTPVPIVTAGIDYKRGQDSMDDVKFSLNFRYAIGQSWQSQISSDEVSRRRSLDGSRYDLVDRNNEIILQYKKKETAPLLADMLLTTIKDNSPADGATVNTVTLHGLSSDGKSVGNAAITWAVTGAAKLSSTAGVTDANGNATVNLTNTTAGQVIVTATSGTISRTTATSFSQSVAALNLVITKNNSQANGTEQDAGQVTLKDASGKVLSGVAIAWQVSSGATVVSSDSTTDANGQAIIRFSSSSPGLVKLSASAGGKSESVNASFLAKTVSNIAVSMTTNNMLASGSNANVAQAVVTDSNGQPMSNTAVTWTLSGSAKAATSATVNTNADGIATLNLTDTVAETVSVTAAAGGKTGTTTAIFSTVPVNSINVAMTTNNAGANGNSINAARALVTAADGRPMGNVSVSWTLSGSATPKSATTVVTSVSGIATIALADTVAENVTVTASAGGKSGNTTATFTPVPVGNVAVSVTTNNSPANNSSANVAQVLVTSSEGVPMNNVSVTWTLTGSATATSATTVNTNASGIATLSLTDAVAEGVTVTAMAGGKTGSTTATFTPVPVGNVAVSMTTDNSPANGSTPNVAQALVTDTSGNPVPNVSVSWTLNGSATAASATTVNTNGSGIATINLADTVAESVTVTASSGGKTGSGTSTFKADASTAHVTSLTIDVNNSPADGGTQNKATATVQDAKGNLVSDATVNWMLVGGSSTISLTGSTSTTDSNGKAVMAATATSPGDIDLNAKSGPSDTGQTKNIAFTGTVTAITLTASNNRGNQDDPIVVTAVATDIHGSPVPDVTVKWAPQVSAYLTCHSPTTTTDSQGKVFETCYTVSGNVFGEPYKVTVFYGDTVDPSTPVTDTLLVDFKP